MDNAAPQQNNTPEMSIEDILKEAMDNPGYVIMVGVVSKRKDAEGNNLLDFHYRRYHYALEDVKKMTEACGDMFQKDVKDNT